MTHALLQPSPFDADCGELIGRDPATVTAEEYATHFPNAAVGMKAIRAKCIDCAHTAVEVRKCTVVTCPLWPLRTGKQPKAYKAARLER